MKIKNYQIQEIIGTGGMATVYLGEQIILERPVALKVMSDHLAADKQFQKIFFIEAKIVAKLEHPNIIRIYDFGVSDNGISFMAMEYLSGGSLREKLDRGCLSFEESLQILEDVGAGLEYSHQSNFIHRDIKPANILFRSDGTAVISDFGIAKLQDTIGDLTRIGYTMGTAEYMSPEQAGTTQLDQRSDIYCLGLVFYEMLTGKKAFKVDTAVQAIYQHTTAPRPDLPDNYHYLQAVMDKVLAKSPNTRYSSVSEFLTAVKEAEITKNDAKTQLYKIPSKDTTTSKKTLNAKPIFKKKGIIVTLLTGMGLVGGGLWLYQLNQLPTHADAQTALAITQQKEHSQRLAAEKQVEEAQKFEAEKKAAEAQKLEAEKQVAEAQKLEAEKQAAEAQKLEAEKKIVEAQKLEAEKKAQEAAKLAVKKEAERKRAKEAAKLSAKKEAERKRAKEAAKLAAKKEAERKRAKEAAKLAAKKEAERKRAKEAAKLAAKKEAERKKAKEAAKLAAKKEAEREKAKEAARLAAKKETERKKAKEAAKLAAKKEAERKKAKEAAKLAAKKEAEREKAKEAARLAAKKEAEQKAARQRAARARAAAKQRADEEAARQRAAKKKVSTDSAGDDLSDRLCTIDCE